MVLGILGVASANKKSRNAKTSHAENPSKSDAVMFFLHILDTDAHSHFNMKGALYTHFQQLLGTPEKALLLSDINFVMKVNPSWKHAACEVDTANMFDEDGNPIFTAIYIYIYTSSFPGCICTNTNNKDKKGS